MADTFAAGEICSRIVVVAERDTPLFDAARRMREQHVGCLVVVDESNAGLAEQMHTLVQAIDTEPQRERRVRR